MPDRSLEAHLSPVLVPASTGDGSVDARLRLLVEGAFEFMGLLAPDGVVLEANRAALVFAGATAAEVVGRPFWETAWWSLPGAAERVRNAVAEAASGSFVRFEAEHPGPGGRSVTVDFSLTPIHDETGRVVSLVAEGRDITELRRAQREAELLLVLTQAISEAESPEQAVTLTLRRVCEATGWAVGEAWLPRADGSALERSTATWGLEQVSADFARAHPPALARGEGLPGRVWASRQPAWIPDVTAAAGLVRGREAHAAGLCSAVAIPVLAGEEVVAVLTFFMRETRHEDARLVRLATAVGAQLGTVFQRKQAEHQHRLAEAKFGGIVSLATDAIVSIDEEQRITLFNGGAERIFGYRAEEVLGQPLELLLPEAFRRAHAAQVRGFGREEANARRMHERGGISGRRKDGDIFPAEASISKLDVGGRRLYTVFLRDVTERRRTEEALRFLAEASALLVETLDEDAMLASVARLAVPTLGEWCAVDVVAEDGAVRRAAVAATDPAWDAQLRRAAGEIGTARAVPEPVAEVLRGGRPLRRENVPAAWFGDAAVAGEEVPSGALLSAPLVTRSQVHGAISVAVPRGVPADDVTSRLALLAELAARVAMGIDNARLYLRARRAVAARDEVLGVVSHDLRNPLSVISMCAASLRQEPRPPAETADELAAAVQQSADWMKRIIADLLDVASIQAGRLSLHTKRQEIGPVVRETVELFGHIAEEGAIALDCSVASGLPAVAVDRERVVQVLSNLLGNACKFTERGGRITVLAERDDGGVRLAVRDTGPGIPADHIPHLFDRFWTSRRGAKQRGTGLGLAIARGIVEAHGGRIWVESTPGEGSTFYFTLPARRQKTETAA